MVTLTTAENALKTLYLGVVTEQLNTAVNPLLTKFEQTTSDVWGKEIRKLAAYGVNGGVGAGSEDGNLPTPGQNNYAQFVLELKNLYGTIEISDKAIRASQNSSGAFVNLLNAEMEGLIKASKFNFGRMLYGDGSGKLCRVETKTGLNTVIVDSVKNLMEGMIVDLYNSSDEIDASGIRINGVLHSTRNIIIDRTTEGLPFTDSNGYFVMQGSYQKELTGLGTLFGNNETL